MRVPLTQYPGMNRFVLDWLAGDERFLRRTALTRPLEPHQNTSQSGDSVAALQTRPAPLVDALIASNRHWGIFASDALRKWGAGETVTLIAGQQVGFAGGPLYTLAKLASLVKMKRELEAHGQAATAFFWLATEDHDFDEIATLCVPAPEKSQLDLLCMRAIRPTDGRAVVGSLHVPEGLITQLLALYDIPRPAWLREGITFRDSFAELIAGLFGKDVILVDALLPELRRAGAPLFQQIHAKQTEIQRALAYRATELEQAGYKEQVVARDGSDYTLLFALDDHGNRVTATATEPPERTSTSALTRPLLQDFVLRPDIFIGGPAEVAYYAQIAPLHELLGVALPRVALRGHVLVAPKRVARALDRYTLEPAEVFAPADRLLTEREPEGVARIRELTEQGRRELLARIEEISELALPAAHSLAGSIQRSIGHLEYHFNKLSERAIKGLVRKDQERYAAVRELVATLHPDGHVQDRVVSWFAYWCTYGEHLVEQVVEAVEPDSAFFKIAVL